MNIGNLWPSRVVYNTAAKVVDYSESKLANRILNGLDAEETALQSDVEIYMTAGFRELIGLFQELEKKFPLLSATSARIQGYAKSAAAFTVATASLIGSGVKKAFSKVFSGLRSVGESIAEKVRNFRNKGAEEIAEETQEVIEKTVEEPAKA